MAISCSSLIRSFAAMSFYMSIFWPRLDVALECLLAGLLIAKTSEKCCSGMEMSC